MWLIYNGVNAPKSIQKTKNEDILLKMAYAFAYVIYFLYLCARKGFGNPRDAKL